jgi:hypothetical protein
MTVIHVTDRPALADTMTRRSLFEGELLACGPRATTNALCDLARTALERLLGTDPNRAQQRLSEVEFLVLFRGAVQAFNSRRVATNLLRAIVTDLGCDPMSTFVSDPAIMAITGGGFLAHGIGVPHHPHRDTWYGASLSQVTWWLPLYDDAASSIAFHPGYWERPVQNTSAFFDCREQGTPDERSEIEVLAEPRPIEAVVLNPDIRIAGPAGGLVLSSAAQLQSIVPNESLVTYFGALFQTVDEADVVAGLGAANVDSESRCITLSRFSRCHDLSPVGSQLIEREARRRPIRRSEEP